MLHVHKSGQGKRKLGRTVSQGQCWMALVTLQVPPSLVIMH